MICRIRVKSRASNDHCPRCKSTDTWRWVRDRSPVRPIAALLGWALLTCRGCSNQFYGRVQRRQSFWITMISRLVPVTTISLGRARYGTKSIARAGVSGLRANAPVAVPKLSFDDWEQRQVLKQSAPAEQELNGARQQADSEILNLHPQSHGAPAER
jgi:hypothetical protein